MGHLVLIELALAAFLALLFVLWESGSDLASTPLAQSKTEEQPPATLTAPALEAAPEQESLSAPDPVREVVVAQEELAPEPLSTDLSRR
ncbi:MAG: hypothetical protein ACI8X5_003227 [Planctomycetota bacterium]|jgi:hypothetical protein